MLAEVFGVLKSRAAWSHLLEAKKGPPIAESGSAVMDPNGQGTGQQRCA